MRRQLSVSSISKRLRRRIVLAAAGGAVIAACGGSSGAGGAGSGSISFYGETQALPAFSFDSGLQPAVSPVQVQLVFSSKGTLTASAEATSGGPIESPAVAGVAGSGEYAIDVRFGLKTRLKVDLSGVKFDGDVPGVESIEIAFDGSESFDPFLLDGSVLVEAAIPETKLPPIPLQAVLGIPGQLVLTIATGSTLSSEFRGTCAAVSNGEAHYVGETTTDGTLIVEPSVEIQVPVIGSQVFDLPPISVPIPPLTNPMDLGSQPVSGGGPTPTGAIAEAGSCNPGGSGGGGGNGSDGGGTGGAGGAAGGGEMCPGATLCNGVCTQTAFDPENCGSCGNACPSGVCTSGVCASSSGGTGGKDGGVDAGSFEVCGNGLDDDTDGSVDESPCCQGSSAGCFMSADCCAGLTCGGGTCN